MRFCVHQWMSRKPQASWRQVCPRIYWSYHCCNFRARCFQPPNVGQHLEPLDTLENSDTAVLDTALAGPHDVPSVLRRRSAVFLCEEVRCHSRCNPIAICRSRCSGFGSAPSPTPRCASSLLFCGAMCFLGKLGSCLSVFVWCFGGFLTPWASLSMWVQRWQTMCFNMSRALASRLRLSCVASRPSMGLGGTLKSVSWFCRWWKSICSPRRSGCRRRTSSSIAHGATHGHGTPHFNSSARVFIRSKLTLFVHLPPEGRLEGSFGTSHEDGRGVSGHGSWFGPPLCFASPWRHLSCERMWG